jgi:hypothetical protein
MENNNNIVLFDAGEIKFSDSRQKKGMNEIFKWQPPSNRWTHLTNRIMYWELIFKNEKTNKSVSITEGGNIVVE